MTGTATGPRRIVYVLERFPADTLNFVYNEIKVLEREGFAVDIFSLLPGTVCPEEARDLAPRTTAVRPLGWRRAVAAWLHYMVRRPAPLVTLLVRLPLDNDGGGLRKALRILGHVAVGVQFAWLVRGRDDHIHAHFAFKAATAALVAARLNGTTFSFTAHGSATVMPAKRSCLRSKVRGAAFVVPVSEYNLRVLRQLCPDTPADRFVVNRTGILLDQFPLRQGGRTGAGPLRIICVASLYPVKNHGSLLRACGLLARRDIPFRLDLVGSDPDGRMADLRRLAEAEGIAERVEFHGSVDHGRIAGLLGDADVCVLTSISEGIPVSLMEAMARGVPVVGPHVTGVPELVRDGETGLLADPDRPEDFAEAFARLVRDPDLGVRLAVAARALVEADYDMVRNAQQLAGVFAARLPDGATKAMRSGAT